jgi:hypothetical protein
LIYENLQKLFPGTTGATLYEMSKRIHDMLVSYQLHLNREASMEALNSKNSSISLVDKGKLANIMSGNLANYWRNNNLQDLNGKFYLSKTGVGLSFLKTFAGFLGLVDVTFDHVKNVTFAEEKESYDKAIKALQTPDGYTALEGIDKNDPKMLTDKLNELLGGQIFDYDEDNNRIVLDVSELRLIQKVQGRPD